MALRWTAAGMLEAEHQFRKIIGYRQLAKLAIAIERDLAHSITPKEVAIRSCLPEHHTRTAVPKFYSERDILPSSPGPGTSYARQRPLRDRRRDPCSAGSDPRCGLRRQPIPIRGAAHTAEAPDRGVDQRTPRGADTERLNETSLIDLDSFRIG
jgi:hypothetical protein